MDLLIDTHVLIWTIEGSKRVSSKARDLLADGANTLFASAVTAWEFADLRARDRLPSLADFSVVIDVLSLRLLALPTELWRLADRLPNLHGDPTDRMLIAHAIHADLTLVTADKTVRTYPVRSLW